MKCLIKDNHGEITKLVKEIVTNQELSKLKKVILEEYSKQNVIMKSLKLTMKIENWKKCLKMFQMKKKTVTLKVKKLIHTILDQQM